MNYAAAVVSVSFLHQQPCRDAAAVASTGGEQLDFATATATAAAAAAAAAAQLDFAAAARIPTVLWIGRGWIAAIRQGVRALSENLYRSMRQWSVNLVVHILFSGIVLLNPALSEAQQCQLLCVINRALEQLLARRCLDEKLMNGIVTLLCPDRGSYLLVTYLVEVIRGLTSAAADDNSSSSSDGNSSDSSSSSSSSGSEEDIEAGGTTGASACEDGKVVRSLQQDFVIEQVYVAAMAPAVRSAVLAVLTHSTPPVCCISLEPLLGTDGRIGADVVAVAQAGSGGGVHAFLYRGSALYAWLGKRQLPTSPETRAMVKPMDVYRLSG